MRRSEIHRSFAGNQLRRLGGQYGQASLDLYPQPVHHSASGKQPMFLQPNHYVYMTVGGAAHMNVGYKPNFDNPDPAGFPKIQFTMTGADRQPSTGPDQTPPRTPPPP